MTRTTLRSHERILRDKCSVLAARPVTWVVGQGLRCQDRRLGLVETKTTRQATWHGTKPAHGISRRTTPRNITPHRTTTQHHTAPRTATAHRTVHGNSTPHRTTPNNTIQHDTTHPHHTAPHHTTPHLGPQAAAQPVERMPGEMNFAAEGGGR